MVSADGTNFSDASGTTVSLPQGTTRLYFKGVDGATGKVSAKVTARMVWKGDAYKGASFANQVGQESIPGPDGYPTRFEAYENTGDPQMYLGEACVNRGGVNVSTTSPTPTPTCVSRPDCIEGEPKNDGRLYCALMGAPPPGTVYCPTPTPTKTPTPTSVDPASCSKYGAKNCPAPCQLGSSCPLCKDLVCKAPGKLTPTPTLPSGCYYQRVKCVQEPCEPVLVCPTPTTIQNQPATITCIISGTPTTAGTYSIGAALSNSKTGLVGRKTLSLTVSGPTTPTPTTRVTPTPTPTVAPTTTPTPTPTVMITTSPTPTTTATPTITTTVTPTATPTPTPWWRRFIPRFSVPSYFSPFFRRPTPTPTRTPPMGVQ